MPTSAPKVSVVVPLYNAGPYAQPCLDSLLGQTLPPGELEILLVDDGSTDDTLARARAVAAEHDHVRVVPIPNSGWPGKPRNVGTDEARGQYVMYVDQDDRVEADALERMHAVGAANGADVVLGKVMSDFRGVNQEVYREERPSCTVHDAPLIESLTPHKMFRTAFLREHGIRYPEGPRRLEDQLFMARAYFAAGRASIVADRVCYRYLRRPDGGNAGSKRFDPAAYYANLREVLDVVDAHVPPGPERDAFYRRFLRVELLGRLGGRKVLGHPEEYLDALLLQVRTLLDERFPDSVAAGMGAAMRVRTAVVRRGTRKDVLDLARRYNAVTVRPLLLGVRATRTGHVVDVEARWTAGPTPLVLDRDGDRLLLPRSVVGELPTDEERRVDDQLDTIGGDLVAQHRSERDEWYLGRLAGHVEADGAGPQVVLRGRVTVDAATASLGNPLRPGVQDLYVRAQAFLWARKRRLGAERAPGVVAAPPTTDSSGRAVFCYDTEGNANLSLDVAPPAGRARKRLAVLPVEEATARRLVLGPRVDPGAPAPFGVRPARAAGTWETAADAAGRLVVTGSQPLAVGEHELVVTDPAVGEVSTGTRLVVGDAGAVAVQADPGPAPRPTARRPVWRRALSRARRLLGG